VALHGFSGRFSPPASECDKSKMPPSLSVTLKREFALSVVLERSAIILQTILRSACKPRFMLSVPPGANQEAPEIQSQFLGLGFPGLYVGLEDEYGVLVHVGVFSAMRAGEPIHAYFAGGRSSTSKAAVAAFAIAVARLVDSPIEDGSGHWMPKDTFSADELLLAMTSSSAFHNCR
jgi:hypothetical protein